MTASEFFKKAGHVPFVEGGRDYNGWDCWGVPYCFFRDVRGILLPEYSRYSSVRDYKQLKKLIDGARDGWNRISQPQLGDIAIFRTGKFESHVGLVVDHNRMMHAEQTIGTFVERFNGLAWGLRLEGVYRYGCC